LLRRTAPIISIVLIAILALAACGGDAASPSARDDAASADPSPSAVASTAASDLSAIACATDDPADVGELTGAWAGDDTGVYYIRQVGDCVWWFGTELRDIERGVTGQPGFANVAAGRVDGTEITVEWADVPMGNISNGGGLTLVYDEAADRLEITERRGEGQEFGATAFVRIEPDASPDPSASSSP
jgi:hypothetical protein